MKKKYLIIFVIFLMIAFGLSYYLNNTNRGEVCVEFDQTIDRRVNDIINDYAVADENRTNLFYYNHKKNYENFSVESYVKWYQKDEITNTTDCITRVLLYSDGELIDERIISFKIDMNDFVIYYTFMLGVADEVIDLTLDERYYPNLYSTNCDIQQEN